MIGIGLCEGAIVFKQVKFAGDQKRFEFVLDAAEIENNDRTAHERVLAGGARSGQDRTEYISGHCLGVEVYLRSPGRLEHG